MDKRWIVIIRLYVKRFYNFSTIRCPTNSAQLNFFFSNIAIIVSKSSSELSDQYFINLSSSKSVCSIFQKYKIYIQIFALHERGSLYDDTRRLKIWKSRVTFRRRISESLPVPVRRTRNDETGIPAFAGRQAQLAHHQTPPCNM